MTKSTVFLVVLASSLAAVTSAQAQECDEEAMLGMDRDDDGIPDVVELYLGTDPDNADTDGDGVIDGFELDTLGTSPLDPDSDGDGLCDGGRNVVGSCVAGEDQNEDGAIDAAEGETDPVCTINDMASPSLRPSIRGTSILTCGTSSDPVGYGGLFLLALGLARLARRPCSTRRDPPRMSP